MLRYSPIPYVKCILSPRTPSNLLALGHPTPRQHSQHYLPSFRLTPCVQMRLVIKDFNASSTFMLLSVLVDPKYPKDLLRTKYLSILEACEINSYRKEAQIGNFKGFQRITIRIDFSEARRHVLSKSETLLTQSLLLSSTPLQSQL